MAGNENSGRKTDWEIIHKYVDAELANRIANKELKRIDEKDSATMDELKVIVMPVALKGMVEKKDINITLPEPLLGGQSNGNIQNNTSNPEVIEADQTA